MKLLLDTHTVLWFFDDVEKLSKKAYDAIIVIRSVGCWRLRL
jgi:PIN domain nuclease of toxin-antitoxin system